MLKLDEFRAVYPEYNDMTDYEISRAVHQSGHSAMPYEQFAKEFGGPVEEDSQDSASA